MAEFIYIILSGAFIVLSFMFMLAHLRIANAHEEMLIELKRIADKME